MKLVIALAVLLMLAASPITGWKLLEQDFTTDGRAAIGQPTKVPCRAEVDYLRGVISDRADCQRDGSYRTLAECTKAQGPQRIFLVNRGDKPAGALLVCAAVMG